MTISFTNGDGISGREAENNSGQRTFTHTYKLKTTDPATEREWQVGSFPGLPSIGDIHPDDPNSYVQRIRVNCSEPPNGWTAVVQYTDERSYNQINPNNPEDPDNPSNSSPEADEVLVSITSENYEVLIDKDKDDEGLVNKAGDPFYTLPTAQLTRLNVNVAFNAAIVPGMLLDRLDHVNSVECTIGNIVFPARTLKYGNLQVGQRKIRNGSPFYPVTYQFKYHPDTWDIVILNAGFREIQGAGGVAAIEDEKDQPISQPHPLDENGHALATPIDPADYHYLTFRYFKEIDFTDMPGVSS